MREAYLQNSCFERFLVFQAKSKANASFNQYVSATLCAFHVYIMPLFYAVDASGFILRCKITQKK